MGRKIRKELIRTHSRLFRILYGLSNAFFFIALKLGETAKNGHPIRKKHRKIHNKDKNTI